MPKHQRARVGACPAASPRNDRQVSRRVRRRARRYALTQLGELRRELPGAQLALYFTHGGDVAIAVARVRVPYEPGQMGIVARARPHGHEQLGHCYMVLDWVKRGRAERRFTVIAATGKVLTVPAVPEPLPIILDRSGERGEGFFPFGVQKGWLDGGIDRGA